MTCPLQIESSVLVSALIHVFVLAALLPLASRAPATMKFDVFAAAPTPGETSALPAAPVQPARSQSAHPRPVVRISRSAATPDVAKPRDSASASATPPASSERSPAIPLPAAMTLAPAAVTAAPGTVTTAPADVDGEPQTTAAVTDPRPVVPEADDRSQAQQPAPPVLATALQPVLATPEPPVTVVADATSSEQPFMPAPPPASVVTAAATEPSASAPAGRTRATRAMPQPSMATSRLGLGFDRVRIRLDGDRTRTTSRDIELISGRFLGGTPTRVVVDVDGQEREPKVDGRVFTTSIALLPGLNRVRVVATDARGTEVEEIVAIHYLPPVSSDVTLTRPLDGHRMAADDPPFVVVEGRVAAAEVTSVSIVTNGRRVDAPVVSGRFRHVVPVLEPVVRIRAETGPGGRGSETVTVDAAAALPALALSLLDWPRQANAIPRITATFRPDPGRLEGVLPAEVRSISGEPGEPDRATVYLREARPGVYTFSVAYQAGTPTTIHPVLVVAGRSQSLPPVTVAGAGRVAIARVLLPQGVLWEQDGWFTGRSASGDTVTKFRFPDGVTWTERIGEPPR
jgi:hypothetical protein